MQRVRGLATNIFLVNLGDCLKNLAKNGVGVCHLPPPSGSAPGRRGCAYTLLQTVQRPGVCSAVYGTTHYKEPLKSFNKSRA